MCAQFFKCPLGREGGCNFFKWCDEAPPAGAPNNPTASYGGGGGGYYANGQANGFGGNAASDAQTVEPAMACPCGQGQCSVLTAKTASNMGRKVRARPPVTRGGLHRP